jgi:hypothetical protein
LTLLLASCAAVPQGFGTLPPQNPGEVRVGTGVGLAGDRQVFELDATFGGKLSPWFGLTTGGSYVVLSDPNMAPIDQLGQGFWPWIRPAFYLGPVTISMPLSGFGLAGPESAIWYGIAGLDLGFATDRAGIHTGIRYDVAGVFPSAEFSSRQLVFGAQYDWDHFGVSVEGIRGDEHGEGQIAPFTGPEGNGRPYASDVTYYMVMIRVSVPMKFAK